MNERFCDCRAGFSDRDHLVLRRALLGPNCRAHNSISEVPSASGDLSNLAALEQRMPTVVRRRPRGSRNTSTSKTRRSGRRRRKKSTQLPKVLGLSLVAVVVSLVAISGITIFVRSYQNAKRLAEGSSNYVEYESQAYGFRVLMPDNYKEERKQTQFMDFSAPTFSVVANDANGCIVEVMVCEVPGEDDWVEKLLRITRELADEIKTRDVTLGGFAAKEAESTSTVNGARLNTVERILAHNEKLYLVTATSVGNDAEHVRRTAGRVADSFVFLANEAN